MPFCINVVASRCGSGNIMLRQIATACIERRIAPVVLFQTRQLQWLAGCAFSINRTCMHTFPAHLLDELARVYARAAVRAYLANTEKDARPPETLAQIADEAMSGADNSRPQYQAMLAAAGRGEIDILLLDDLSRLSRDQVESEQVIRRLEFHGVRIIAVSDGYDSRTKTATRKIQRGVKNLINEMRLDELREQVHRGLTGQAMKRYWCGGRPYGYRLKPILDPNDRDAYGNPSRIKTVLEIDKAQAEIVAEIFASYARGVSYFAIARTLNERGVPSPGSSWKRRVRRCRGSVGSAVRVVLRNPLYTGHVRWNVSQFVRDPDTGALSAVSVPKRSGFIITMSRCASSLTSYSRKCMRVCNDRPPAGTG
jgi:DNA invertase Pin-like site-specific DNA recombinase